MCFKNKIKVGFFLIIFLSLFITMKVISVEYVYDDLGRVKTANFENSLQTVEYVYDFNGNIINTKTYSMIKELYDYPSKLALEVNQIFPLNINANLVNGNSKEITNLCLFEIANENIAKVENNNIVALNKGRTELIISVHNIYKKIPILITDKNIEQGGGGNSSNNISSSNKNSNYIESSSYNSDIESGNNSLIKNENIIDFGSNNNNIDNKLNIINWNKILNKINKLKNEEIVRINISNKTLIDSALFSLIKQKNITLILDYGYYEWRFIGKEIDLNLINKNGYDLSVNFESPNKSEIYKLTQKENIINLYINYHGQLPSIAALDIKLNNIYSEKQLNLYYYNNIQNQIEYYGKVKTDNYCWTRIALNHCSDYILSNDILDNAYDVSTQVINPNILGEISDFLQKPYTDIEANINSAVNENIINIDDYIESNFSFILLIIFILIFIILLVSIFILIILKKRK